jgi:hypothetical protein
MQLLSRSCLVSGLLLLAIPAQADETTDCKFKWSVAREKAWFEGSPQEIVSSGEAPQIDKAYTVSLKPVAESKFVKPPLRTPKPDSFGTVLSGPAIDKPGVCEIPLSSEGWIDAMQNSEIVKSVDFSGLATCPSVRKTVRYELSSGPLTIQLSSVAQDKILLAIATAE